MKFTKEIADKLNKTHYDYLLLNAKKNPDKKLYITEHREYTYGEVLQIVNSLIVQFHKNGIKNGTEVGIRTTKTAACSFIIIALGAIGALSVLTDVHFGLEEYLEKSGVNIHPEFYITDETEMNVWKLYSSSFQELDSINADIKYNDLELVNQLHSQVDPEQGFCVYFTSGSTGKSKAIILSHRGAIANAVGEVKPFDMHEDDVAMSLLPLNHSFGIAVLTVTIYNNETIIYPQTFTIEHILECIEKYRISILFSVPTMFLDFISLMKTKSYDVSSMRNAIIGGAACPKDQMFYIERKLNVKVITAYASSEAIGICCNDAEETSEYRCRGVGKSWGGLTEIKIKGKDGVEVPVGKNGEICVRGATLMNGYYDNEEENKKVLDSEGFIHTGDLGFLDETGYLIINGRMKDIIIRGGENLSGGKIEKAVNALEYISFAIVVPVADERLGEVVGAMAVIKKEYEGITAERIRDDLRITLTKIELPQVISLVDAIPLTFSEKPDKLKIKSMLNEMNK